MKLSEIVDQLEAWQMMHGHEDPDVGILIPTEGEYDIVAIETTDDVVLIVTEPIR
jgi:hypothetical protein